MSTQPPVLILAAFYHPHIDGVTSYVSAIASELAKKGHEVHVLTSKLPSTQEREIIDGVHVSRLDAVLLLGGTYPVLLPTRRNARMLRDLSKKNFACINTHTRFFATSTLGARLARKWKVRHVHTEHGNQHVPHANHVVRAIAWMWDHTIGKRLLRGSDAIICISRPGVEFVKGLGVRENIRYIPNGIRTENFPARTRAPRRARIVYVGRLVKEKGVHDLIVEAREDEEVIIIGDGPARQELEKLARGKRVTFTGKLPQADVSAWLRRASVVANPSWAEGLPTSVIEAACTGVPVVATDVGGTRDILPDNPMLHSPGDRRRLRELLDEALTAGRQQQAQIHARKARKTYSIKRITSEVRAALLNTHNS